MKCKILILIFFCTCFGFSQSHKATLSKIEKDGFHQITISPEIISASKDNLDYFRILDQSNKEVPFSICNNSRNNALFFQKLNMLSQSNSNDSITSIIVSLNELKNITELSLIISNTTIKKSYSISGSNNQQEWFGLVSNQLLSNLNNENGSNVEKIISLPINNYKFLRFDFNNKKSLPINILEIGYYINGRNDVEKTVLTDFKYKISEDKKHKKTILTFTSDNFQRVDGVSFDVTTKLFLRNASVLVNRTRKVKKRTETFQKEIASFNLNSNTSNAFQFNAFFEKEFMIEIDNQDNQPIEISKIKIFQNKMFVVADLKKNGTYKIIIDSAFSKPNYDLANFTQNLSSDLPKATILNVKKINTKINNASEKTFWQKPIFLWSAILLTLILLAYFVFNMLKDVEKN